jgi:hypothetical protein
MVAVAAMQHMRLSPSRATQFLPLGAVPARSASSRHLLDTNRPIAPCAAHLKLHDAHARAPYVIASLFDQVD